MATGKKLTLAVIALACFFTAGGCASSAGSGARGPASTITIVNSTGYEVWYVYVSPSDDDSWGQDLLDIDQTLPDGESFSYTLPQPLRVAKVYDIQLVDSDEDSYTKWGVTLSNNSKIVFTFDDFDDE